MYQTNPPKLMNRRQLIKTVTHTTLGVAGVFAAIGVEYQKPTLTKLMPLKQAAAMADSGGAPSRFDD